MRRKRPSGRPKTFGAQGEGLGYRKSRPTTSWPKVYLVSDRHGKDWQVTQKGPVTKSRSRRRSR